MMLIKKISVERYHRSQARILQLAKAYSRGDDVYDQISQEYSRLCYALAPSPSERAMMVLAKALREERKSFVDFHPQKHPVFEVREK